MTFLWFQVYICEMEEKNASKCAMNNIHQRTFAQISKLAHDWDPTPAHFYILDIKTFLQDKVVGSIINYGLLLSPWFLLSTFFPNQVQNV